MANIVIKNPIPKKELSAMAQAQFGDVVKATVDIVQGIMALGGELHADEEILLMEQEGSERQNTWGINLYPQKSGDEFIEFDSMINIKIAYGNRSRTVENQEIRKRITEIVRTLIIK